MVSFGCRSWCLLPTLATNDHSYLMFHGLLRSLLLKLRKYNRSPKYQTSRRAPGRLTSERQRRLGAATCTSARQAGSRATESRSSNGHQRAPDGHQGNEGSKRQPALAGTRRAPGQRRLGAATGTSGHQGNGDSERQRAPAGTRRAPGQRRLGAATGTSGL